MMMESEIVNFGLTTTTILSVGITSLFILTLGLYYLKKLYSFKPPQSAQIGMVDEIVTVAHWQGRQGEVIFKGEAWQAISDETLAITKGDKVKIIKADSLILTIIPHQP